MNIRQQSPRPNPYECLKTVVTKVLTRFLPLPFLLITTYLAYAFVLFLDSQNQPNFFDENSFLMNVLQFGTKKTIVPFFTNYPTFYSYIIAGPIYIVYGIYYLYRHFPLGGFTDPLLFALIFQGDLDIWLWVGRTVSIIFAVAIMYLVTSHNLAGDKKWAVAFSTLILFCDPYGFYMTHARYALPDIMVVLLVTLMMLTLYRYLQDPRKIFIYIAGFLVGLATSAKFNAVLAMTPVVFAPFLVHPKRSSCYQCAFVAVLLFIMAFFLGSPALFFSSHSYADSFQFEANILYNTADNISRGWLLEFLWRGDAFFTMLLLLTIGFTIWRHNKEDILFHVLLIPSVIFLTGLDKKTATYLLFLYPVLIIKLSEFLTAVTHVSNRKYLSIPILAVVLIGSCHIVGKLYDRLEQSIKIDNRVLAREWIYKNVPPGSSILIDWGYVPTLGFRDLGVLRPSVYLKENPYPEIVAQYMQHYLYRAVKLLELNYKLTAPVAQTANYLVTSNWCYERYLTPTPELPNIVVYHGDPFRYYLMRRKFYVQLLGNDLPFKLIKTFREGSGPAVLVFQRKE